MSPKSIRRGFDAEDSKWFSENAVEKLRIAQMEVQWLIDRGYRNGSVIEFIGNHYQFSLRQRIALHRATASTIQLRQRESGMLPMAMAGGGHLLIDGFNLIIALEVALSGSVLILGNDGVIRDLAGLRGTYSIIGQTEMALELIGNELKALKVSGVKFYLDAPVSNSGRLKKLILRKAKDWGIPVEAEVVPDADAVLSKSERVVTGDSVILDACGSWFNLSRKIIEEKVKDAWIVELTGGAQDENNPFTP